MALLYILVFFLLLRTTDTRKKKCNERIIKLFRKTRRGQFEMLSDFNSLDSVEPFYIRSGELINIEQLEKF